MFTTLLFKLDACTKWCILGGFKCKFTFILVKLSPRFNMQYVNDAHAPHQNYILNGSYAVKIKETGLLTV